MNSPSANDRSLDDSMPVSPPGTDEGRPSKQLSDPVPGPLGGSIGPVMEGERIGALDVLRGFALLGILIMNIQTFAMIEAAYMNPTAYGDLGGLNGWVSRLSTIFADQKFMTIFSILFGAGICLMARRIEERGLRPAGTHYRRTLALLAIGFVHAYGWWYGDVLFIYSICAMFVYLLRRVRPWLQVAVGLILFSIPSLLFLWSGFTIPYWPSEVLNEMTLDWKPTAEMISAELAAYRGGWQSQMTYRVPQSIAFHTLVFLYWGLWRVCGLMLLGMALLKWDVLTAKRSTRFYTILAAVGLGIGLPLVIFGYLKNVAAGYAFEYSMFLGSQFNYWGSLLVCLGYIAVVMLICRREVLARLLGPLAAVGRLALTNYLMQTLLCTLLFYGHGFGLFGHLERTWQVVVVLTVWVIQLVFSATWVRRYRFGPAEWVWRTMTYLRFQPMSLRTKQQEKEAS